MNKSIPLWLFLLFILFGALFMVAFGWTVKETVVGEKEMGALGAASVNIANFPNTVTEVIESARIDSLETDELVQTPRPEVDFSGFKPLKSDLANIDDVIYKADMQGLNSEPGWRILVGAFSFDGVVENAAIALSPELEVANVWYLTEEAAESPEVREPHRKFVHGFDILDDASVVYTFDGSVSANRIDACSKNLWSTAGWFHHSLTLTEDQKFVWGFYDDLTIAKLDVKNGEIVKRFTMNDIIAANPEIDLFQIRQIDDSDLGGNSRNTEEKWLEDPYHLNDVDPLPTSLAGYFDGLSAGDLMLSSRSLNLIFIIDPETLEVKWWRFGATRRQHDPDWSDGTITVFDNRMSRDYSNISRIDAKTYETVTEFDGSQNDFYSRIRGKHQFTPNGHLLIASAQQGRFFETDRAGRIVFEAFNQKPGSDRNFVVSQSIWLPKDKFNSVEDLTCKK